MLTKNTSKTKQFGFIAETLEDLIEPNHIVRSYEEVIDWNFIYPLVEDMYSKYYGKPSIDPVILFKLVFLNYAEGIHSMRKTCELCKYNIAYRWFLGIDLHDKIPDHSTYSQNYRRKFKGTKIFEQIFTQILSACYDKGYIDNEVIFGDSTHVKANANKRKSKNEIIQLGVKIYQEELDKEVNEDRIKHGKKPFNPKIIKTDEKKTMNDDEPDDELIKYDDAEEIIDINGDGESDNDEISTYDPETGEIKTKKRYQMKTKNMKVSKTDPDAGMYHKGEREKMFAYSASAICDKNGFVLSTYVTSGNIHDSVSFFGIMDAYNYYNKDNKTKKVCLDAGYYVPSVLKSIYDSGKIPLVPYMRPKTKSGFFKKNDYVYDEMFDQYICPNIKLLNYSTTNREGYKIYKSNPKDCESCPLRSQCTNSKNHTKVVTRHIWEDYKERAHDDRHKLENIPIYKQRKETIERIFADAKENYGLRYTRYRGIDRVSDHITLLFSAMNLKKMARWNKSNKDLSNKFLFFCRFILNFINNLKKSEKKEGDLFTSHLYVNTLKLGAGLVFI